jgi:hypothetical protein
MAMSVTARHPYPQALEDELQAIYSPYLQLKAVARFQPYLTIIVPSNLRSAVINTDEYGFRRTLWQGQALSLADYRAYEGRAGLILGGSVPFGTATTHDRYTLPNLLNQQGDLLFWNGGIGGCNGFVEQLIYLLINRPYEVVFSLSGANDLIIHLGSPRRFPWGVPFEGEESFYQWNMGQGATAGFDPPSVEALDDFIALCKSADSLPSPRQVSLLAGAQFVAERYQACLQAMREQVRFFKALQGESYFYLLNPHLYYSKTVSAKEEAFFYIGLSRMPHYTRCTRLIIRELYPQFRQDVAALCAEEGVPLQDANTFTLDDDEMIFIDDFHPTDRGFVRIAQNLRDRYPVWQKTG